MNNQVNKEQNEESSRVTTPKPKGKIQRLNIGGLVGKPLSLYQEPVAEDRLIGTITDSNTALLFFWFYGRQNDQTPHFRSFPKKKDNFNDLTKKTIKSMTIFIKSRKNNE